MEERGTSTLLRIFLVAVVSMFLLGCWGVAAGGENPRDGNAGENALSPGPVNNVSSMAADASIEIRWTDPEDSSLAKIFVSWEPNGIGEVTVPAGTEAYTATGLDYGVAYTFSLIAADEAGNRSPVVTANATTGQRPPGSVTGLSSSEGINEITLDWSDPTDADLAYIAVRWTPDDLSGDRAVDPGSGSVTISGLTPRTTYEFTLRPVDALGNAGPAKSVTATALHSRDVVFPGIEFFPLSEAAGQSMSANGVNSAVEKYYTTHGGIQEIVDLFLDRPLARWQPNAPSTYTYLSQGTRWTVEWTYTAGGGQSFFQPPQWCWVATSGQSSYRSCITDTTLDGLDAWRFDFFASATAQVPYYTGTYLKAAPSGEAAVGSGAEQIDVVWARTTDGQTRYWATMDYLVDNTFQERLQFNQVSADGTSGQWSWVDVQGLTDGGSW